MQYSAVKSGCVTAALLHRQMHSHTHQSWPSPKQSKVRCWLSHVCTCAESITLKIDGGILPAATQNSFFQSSHGVMHQLSSLLWIQIPTFVLLSDVFISLNEVLLLSIWRQVDRFIHGHAAVFTSSPSVFSAQRVPLNIWMSVSQPVCWLLFQLCVKPPQLPTSLHSPEPALSTSIPSHSLTQKHQYECEAPPLKDTLLSAADCVITLCSIRDEWTVHSQTRNKKEQSSSVRDAGSMSADWHDILNELLVWNQVASRLIPRFKCENTINITECKCIRICQPSSWWLI